MFKKFLFAVAGLLASAGIAFAAVDINTADKAALDSVKGIGPATADKIIAARKAGKFTSWDDMIKRVDGIGEKSAANLSGEGLTVDGKSYKGAAPKAATKAEKDKPTADAGKADKPVAKDAAKSDKPSKEAAADAKADKPTKAEAKAAPAKEKAEKAEKKAAATKEAARSKDAKKEAKKEESPAKDNDAKKEEKPKQ